MDRTDALRKYQSLRRMTVARGATPAEADTAQGLADRLAARFGFGPADETPRTQARNPFEGFTSSNPWDMNDILRRAREAAAREQAARQAQARERARAQARENVRQAREDARRRQQAEGEQARERQSAQDRQWQYDFEAARRTWHWEMRKCGDPSCRCARVDLAQAHGPYRYAKKRTGNKVNSVYLGKGRDN